MTKGVQGAAASVVVTADLVIFTAAAAAASAAAVRVTYCHLCCPPPPPLTLAYPGVLRYASSPRASTQVYVLSVFDTKLIPFMFLKCSLTSARV